MDASSGTSSYSEPVKFILWLPAVLVPYAFLLAAFIYRFDIKFYDISRNFMLAAVSPMAWAYTVSFIVQMAVVSRNKLSIFIAVSLALLSCTPLVVYVFKPLVFVGGVLALLGFAFAGAGHASVWFGLLWVFAIAPFIVAVCYSLVLTAIVRLSGVLESRKTLNLRNANVVGAISAILVFVIGQLFLSLVSNPYAILLACSIAILAFVPHQILLWRKIGRLDLV